MNTPYVSVVIAVYNGAETIEKALDSVAAQTYTNVELICVEDGSRDTTFEVLSNWKKNHPSIHMTLIQNEKNMGLAASLNRGIDAARGEFVARIDADDMWTPEKLEKQVTYLSSHPDIDMIGTFYINEKGKDKRYIRLPVTNKEIKKTMFRKNPFGHSCVVIRKKAITDAGGYDGSLREDRDLWFRLLPHIQFHNVPEFLVVRNISTSHFVSPKELRRNIQTVHTYIKKYKAPIYTYIWLLEPIAVYIYHSLKKYVARA